MNILLKQIVNQLPKSPGVYKMIHVDGSVLYVGKAKNLFKRVSNYLNIAQLSQRIAKMISQVNNIETILTKTEVEALLLEASLIRNIKPKYNILLKDDKSFPYIAIYHDHKFPRIAKYRGLKKDEAEYFGPFSNSSNVEETVSLLQKLFLLRGCSDNYFKQRSRPCIMYQIKRCSAPCVGYIPHDKYQESINQAKNFLYGKNTILQQELIKLMNDASVNLDYESAAIYRDRIKALNNIQSRQALNNLEIESADVVVEYSNMGETCVLIFSLKASQSFGNRIFYPENIEESEDVISAFLPQIYSDTVPPEQIILAKEINDQKLIEKALSQIYNKKIKIKVAKKEPYLKLVDLALENAKQAIQRKIDNKIKNLKNLESLKEIFNLSKIPKRIEVYDNSHIMGSHAVGAMIVMKESGFDKSSYRKFDMKDFNGDDYKMLEAMLKRRFSRLKKEYPQYLEGVWPDLLIIDGGPAQASITAKVIDELNMDIKFVTIAKSENRNAGNEIFYQKDAEPFSLDNSNKTMQFLQRLRDEAHRYAITSHRNKRDKNLKSSVLNQIKGIGKKKKILLLNSFGSIKAIQESSVEDLMKIKTISKNIALEIYNFFRKNQNN